MSWASRRRSAYFSGVILFFVIVIGGPVAYYFLSIPDTCSDGKQNQGETAIDKGGPCAVLDERYLQPYSVMWARSFKVRDGSYTAAAYVENPNPNAGAEEVHYQFGLYDSGNVLIADRSGTMFIMPGGITPVIETGIDTGNREVVHTYFQITDASLVWKLSSSPATDIKINDQAISGENVMPRIDARATNASLDSRRNVKFIAVVFDPAGNAFAASGTALAQLDPNAPASIAFAWPEPFASTVGRIDIIPLLPPIEQTVGAH